MNPLLLALVVTSTSADLKMAIEESQAIAGSCLVELSGCSQYRATLRELLYSQDVEIEALRLALEDRPAPLPVETPSPVGALVTVAVAASVCAAISAGLGAHFDGAPVRGALIGGGGGALLCAATVAVGYWVGAM